MPRRRGRGIDVKRSVSWLGGGVFCFHPLNRSRKYRRICGRVVVEDLRPDLNPHLKRIQEIVSCRLHCMLVHGLAGTRDSSSEGKFRETVIRDVAAP
jgi:hypothetical protein